MVSITKDTEGRWCNSCNEKNNVYKIRIGYELDFTSSAFLCKSCLDKLIKDCEEVLEKCNKK